ncbi:MAG: hypothetical protein PHP64_05445 [Actinomycetota bacterium]|nr:hypothetical protein [Actinomycetota bacterium]
MKRSLKVTIIVFSIILVIFVASEIVIPAVACRYIKSEVKKRYPEVKDLSVSIKSFPAFMLLFKKYNKLKLSCRNITIEGVNFDSLVLTSSFYPDARVKAELSENRINQMFSSTESFILNPKISLFEEKITVVGEAKLEIGTFDIFASGNLELRNKREIYFKPDDIEVLGTSSPGQVVDVIRNVALETPLLIVRKDLPVEIESIASKPKNLVTRGKLNLKTALKISI